MYSLFVVEIMILSLAINTSRSPAAEYLAKWLKATMFKEELRDVNFDSAGLYSYYKTPQEGTATFLESKNIDFSDFKGKKITEELISKQDLILGFERKWHIINKLPGYAR